MHSEAGLINPFPTIILVPTENHQAVRKLEFKLKRFENVLRVSHIANIHYFEFTQKYHTFRDKHSFRELLYVDSGFIHVDGENYTGTLQAGELLIHQTDETHSLTCPEDEAANVIIVGFSCNTQELDAFSHNPTLLSDVQRRLLTEIIMEGRSVFLPPYDIPNQRDMKKRKNYPYGADQMIQLKMETLLIDLIRTNQTLDDAVQMEFSDEKIQALCYYLNENYKEKIRLSELCFLFGTNKTTLCDRFRVATGETIVSYVNHLRIKEAKRLLRRGNHNLTEIAAMVGFSSVHYFSRTFKQYENQAPSAYIRTIKARLEV